MTETKLIVADALALFAESLSISLGLWSGLYVHEEHPSNAPGVIEGVFRLKPDVLLVDYFIPDMEGPALIKSVLSRAPECRVVVLSWIFGSALIQEALDAGAAALLPKSCTVAEVVDTIRRVSAGETQVNAVHLERQITTRLDHYSDDLSKFQSLTPREMEILALLNSGRSYQQIAKRLSLSPKTVRNHIARMLAKTGAQSQNDVLAKARNCGFFPV